MARDLTAEEKAALEYNNCILPVMSQLSEPLQSQFHISLFIYATFPSPKKSLHISNHQGFTEAFIGDRLYESVPYERMNAMLGNANQYIIYWNKNNCPIKKSANSLNLFDGMSICTKHDNHIDVVTFGTTASDDSILEFYANNLPCLERFIVYFKNKAHDLISTSDEKRLLTYNDNLLLNIPRSLDEKYKEDFIILTKLESLRITDKLSIRVTRREVECMYLLSMGMSIKEIAKLLGISPKTVEYFLSELKIKLHCRYKSELINIFNKNLKAYYQAELQIT